MRQRQWRVAVRSDISGLIPACHKYLQQHEALRSLLAQGRLLLSDDASDSFLSDCTVLLCDPRHGARLIDASATKNITWMQSTYAGVNVLLNNSKRRDYELTRVGTGFGPQMAEYCMGWILHHYLEINKLVALQRERRWFPEAFDDNKKSIDGQSMCLLGAGNIATSVASAARSMGMRVTGYCRTNKDASLTPFHQIMTDLDKALVSADVIVNTLPSTIHTTGLLTIERLSNLERQPLFLNVGRGDIITQEALIRALDKRYLRHAVLDVVEAEPLAAESALWSHSGVNITPHISAVSTPDIVARVFADNLAKHVSEQQLRHVVSMKLGY
jgi:phosphoglycerate dehydrogenase-like enzyme